MIASLASVKLLFRYVLLVIIYITLSQTIALTKGEQRPFFTGKWFFKTPTSINDYGLYILAVADAPSLVPTYLDRIVSSQFDAWTFDAYNLSQQIGEAITNQSETEIKSSVAQLRKVIFREHQVDFEVHRRQFSTVDFIENGKILHHEVLAKFLANEKNEP